VAKVVEDWERAPSNGPWGVLFEEHRVDQVPQMLQSVLSAALCAPPNDRGAITREIRLAAQHGARRRALGLTASQLRVEYAELTRAVQHHFRSVAAEPAVRALLARIEPHLAHAERAAAHGYRYGLPDPGALGVELSQLIESASSAASPPERRRSGPVSRQAE
jgi:hypothetical protein